MFNFTKYSKIYFIFSGILILGALACLIVFGLRPGIEFTGGSILEVEYKESRPLNEEIKEILAEFDMGEIQIQQTGERGVILRTKEIDEQTHQEILEKLKQGSFGLELEENRFETIGPIIGRELKEKTKNVAIISLLAIITYISFAFRKISHPINSWQYGIAAIIALFYDVLITIGVFSVLGNFYNVQITIPVVTALLTVFGYSVNNTVVVFDRIRENLLQRTSELYEEVVNKSLNQTLTRSINTSLTTLFVLFAIFFFGGETLRYFALALILGIISGTYSSIFLTSPLLVSWLKRKQRKRG